MINENIGMKLRNGKVTQVLPKTDLELAAFLKKTPGQFIYIRRLDGLLQTVEWNYKQPIIFFDIKQNKKTKALKVLWVCIIHWCGDYLEIIDFDPAVIDSTTK